MSMRPPRKQALQATLNSLYDAHTHLSGHPEAELVAELARILSGVDPNEQPHINAFDQGQQQTGAGLANAPQNTAPSAIPSATPGSGIPMSWLTRQPPRQFSREHDETGPEFWGATDAN